MNKVLIPTKLSNVAANTLKTAGYEVVQDADTPLEEQAAAQSVDRRAEPQILIHLRRREADVHAVHIGKEIGDQDQRQDAPERLAHCGPSDCRYVPVVRRHDMLPGADTGFPSPEPE